MLIRPTCSAIACMRTIRNLRRTHAEILGIQRYFLSTKTGPEVKKTASERLNLKSLDTRLSDDQIDELIDGLQKDFDKGFRNVYSIFLKGVPTDFQKVCKRLLKHFQKLFNIFDIFVQNY